MSLLVCRSVWLSYRVLAPSLPPLTLSLSPSILLHHLALLHYQNGSPSSLSEDEWESEKKAQMRLILGESKCHYAPLIEQLLFMEQFGE